MSPSNGDARQNGIRARRVVSRVFGTDKGRKRGRRGFPVAHQAMLDDGRRQRCEVGDRPYDERVRHADAELAGQQLVQEEQLAPLEARPPREHVRAPLVVVHRAERQDSALDPLRQRHPIDVRVNRLRWIERQPSTGSPIISNPGSRVERHDSSFEQERDGFSKVARRGIRLLDEPLRQPGQLQRPGVHRPRGDVPLEPAAGQEEERPGGVCGRRVAQIRDERRHLRIGGGRPIDLVVQVCETPHGDQIVSGLQFYGLQCAVDGRDTLVPPATGDRRPETGDRRP